MIIRFWGSRQSPDFNEQNRAFQFLTSGLLQINIQSMHFFKFLLDNQYILQLTARYFLSQYRVHTQIAKKYSSDTEVNCPHFYHNRLLALELSQISFKYEHTYKVLQVQALSIKSWHLVMKHLVIMYLYNINVEHLDAVRDVVTNFKKHNLHFKQTPKFR